MLITELLAKRLSVGHLDGKSCLVGTFLELVCKLTVPTALEHGDDGRLIPDSRLDLAELSCPLPELVPPLQLAHGLKR